MSGLTFSKCIILFSDYMRDKNWTDRTRRTYLFRLKYFFNFLREKDIYDLRDVTKKDLYEYAQILGYTKSKNYKTKLSVNTQSSYFRVVSALFHFLLKYDYILEDVSIGIILNKRQAASFCSYLTEEEARALLSLPDTQTILGFRDHTILEVFYGTGLRKSELINLKVSDVNFDENILFVYQGKGMKDRIVPFGDVARYYLKKYIEGPRKEILQGNYLETSLFLSYLGKKISENGINKILKKYLDKLCLNKKIVVHSLRHSFAVHMLKNGTDIRYIQAILGHSSLESSYHYTRLKVDHLKKMYDDYHPFENQLYENVLEVNKKHVDKITKIRNY